MQWSDMLWLAVGFLAQVFFAARFLSQWLLSERAGRSVLPIHFWYLSVAGAVLLLAYAVHRRDPVIVAGQLASLGIYLRNLRFMLPQTDSFVVRRSASLWLGLVGLAVVVGYHVGPDSALRPLLVHDFWTVFGFVGQFLFTGRFVVQWWVTERERRSLMPRGFWYLSIVGTLMLLSYAVAVRDPVIIVGQCLGLVVYARNLVLMARSRDMTGGLKTR
ncbi:lipid-A-disaccharide synthase N-terminal domain-containing protein [Thiococcus pfennigii]|uniref:lipid-A-disaccharide synthase N-terminal domain-containing protein n=1 Tax=Thiococcus pfennigii TaxID=1057 RepID=UPI001F5C08FF|nr:lipid-A-disaccharide synthase N-terminal domain-containing protein [Thiococcus pfennigii]MBK1731749.1 hypothetical protein [Thiococcus pfennigii]